MAEFRSPIGNKQIKGAPMRDFTVPDETGFQPPAAQYRQPGPQETQHPPFDPQAMRDFQQAMQPQPQQFQVKELTEVEQQMMAAKKAQREGKQRLSPGAKHRVEMLIGMTRLTREVTISENIYKLQSLSSKELRDALTATAEFDGTVAFIFETRRQLLARSLVTVAGVDISQFLNSYELEDRLDFIEEMDHALLVRLYNEYTEMNKDAQDKYSLKTEAQVKEVLEDLKK